MLSEPAIQVRRKGKGKQIWALEKMENRLVDMRELYQEWKDYDEDNAVRPLQQEYRQHLSDIILIIRLLVYLTGDALIL